MSIVADGDVKWQSPEQVSVWVIVGSPRTALLPSKHSMIKKSGKLLEDIHPAIINMVWILYESSDSLRGALSYA